MLHILVTNDDGVHSPGLFALTQALAHCGRVSVIAPDSNRSAIGRGVTVRDPLHVEEVRLPDGSLAFATDGTPVDCVRFATLGLLGSTPDLIVSGINLGLNLGDDVTYSGTVAAALEGVLLGWPSIAVSVESTERDSGKWEGRRYDFRAVAAFTAALVPVVASERFPRDVMLNVNGPGLPPTDVAGVRVTRLGRRIYHDELVLESVEGARRRYSIYGNTASYRREDGTDFAAIEAGEISVTPMHFDLTDVEGMSQLEQVQLADLLQERAWQDVR